ncbi:di-N-acetylchitobiase-like [Stegostoma tigrinum]|uniref:di-N-acetylchitobiase-like n=1 Tax=Stegostoma tigrinum TaxID=3053191 RepID=UPI0028701680|nr:di-N-acetylchitobiase-like [Stegostoma tigrinum]
MVEKAQQHFFFLKGIKKFGTSIRILTNSYRSSLYGFIMATLPGTIVQAQTRIANKKKVEKNRDFKQGKLRLEFRAQRHRAYRQPGAAQINLTLPNNAHIQRILGLLIVKLVDVVIILQLSSSPSERMRWSLVSAQLVAVLALGILPGSGISPWHWCPCSSPNLCDRVPADHQYQVEAIVFDNGGSSWKHYDWSKITAVVLGERFDLSLLCSAHEHKVRVILKAKINLDVLADQIHSKRWITRNADFVKTLHMDGINMEVRQAINNESTLYNGLTRMIRDTVEMFHEKIPGSQVTFNAPWSPHCVDDQCYDFVELAKACDYLIVKSFDVQSQMWDECFAKANAPYDKVFSGLSAYVKLGIDPKKLVMGIPWFGYDYPCERFFEPGRCNLEEYSFRGARCSSEKAKVVPYKDIIQQLPKSITGRYWDDNYKAPYYVYKKDDQYHEVWYDDPESISLKSSILKKLKLRGISVSAGNNLNYSTNPLAAMQTEEMWNALCPF